MLEAARVQVELYARELEVAGRAPSTVARRLAALAGLYQYAVDERVLARSPLAHVRRPTVATDSQTTGLDRDQLRALDRLIDTMARATQELRALSGPPLAERLDELVTYIAQQRELTIDSASKIGGQLAQSIEDELSNISHAVPDESGISMSTEDAYLSKYNFGDESEYRRIVSKRVSVQVDRPAEVSVQAVMGTAVVRDLSSRFTYRIIARTGEMSTRIQEVPDLDLRFEDLYPSLSTAAHARIVLFVETLVGWLLDQAKAELRKVLRQAGYDSFSKTLAGRPDQHCPS